MATAIQRDSKKTVFITGANGLLGQKLVNQLLGNDQFYIVASGRGACRLPGEGFEYISLDISDEAEVQKVIAHAAPDIIIHGAAMTHVDECELNQEACYDANVNATAYLVKAAEACQAHFIFVSTDFIFSGEEGPLDESGIPAPVNYYGESKLLGEKMVMRSKTKWAIARTVLVFGIAHDLSRSNIVLWVKSSLEAGKTIQVVDDQYRTPTLAEDLAAGCILIAEQGAEGVFNISGPDFLTPYEMANTVADFFGLNKDLIKRADSTTFTQPAKRPLKTGFIIKKAQEQLGFEPKTFRTAIGILAKQIILARS
ncbi:SDR family oxidoreductase [Algoriphagus halophytocola]|uniref:dTDP-4-dehydrorhamnose reductase n=1 Tax=Algoriphagus halophytocola TaxID=2991499 RepID=A0ABY6MPH3_9BACT|nr:MULTISPECIES: SDR family oxidoreductase [unclassified Algoriphagus]UZD24646.1 SDR family oxidoreductase [Algoriphagus sp. TR-M5]WBL42014.1 SDR family oxidoreductase [Algoriphagus sp. TR-M9]